MDFYNKHYIRVDTSFRLIYGFSDAFEQPKDGDICINENGDRLFEINGDAISSLVSPDGVHLYKYVNDVIIETTEEERATEKSTFPPPPSTIAEQFQRQITLDSLTSSLVCSQLDSLQIQIDALGGNK